MHQARASRVLLFNPASNVARNNLVSHGAGRTMAGDCASGADKLVGFLAVICSGDGR